MSSIKQELVRGVLWSAVEKYSGLVVSIVVSMILARLLSPAEYGVVAIATIIITFLQMFCTMGIGPAIIQKDLSVEALNSIFTFSLLLGAGLTILLFSCSWNIATFYSNSQLIPVCQILSLQLFFASLNMVPNALMAKNKRFKEIAKRTLLLQVSSGFISVIAAWQNAGVYALLISPIFTSIGIFFWNRMYYKVKIDKKFNMEPIKQIFSYSSYQFLFEFANYFSRNMDKLIIGRMLNVDALGIYEKSYRLMQLPLQNVSSVINPVMQPVLRTLQNDRKSLAGKYEQIIRLVATISFPVGVICADMSKEIISVFYGGNWGMAIPIFSILSLSLPLQMIQSTSGSIFLICNNTRMQFWLGLRNTITTMVGFLIAAVWFHTLEAMAWAWTITLVINFVFTYWLMYRYVLCEPIVPFLKELLRPALIAILLHLLLMFLNMLSCLDYLLWALIVKVITSGILTLVTIQMLGQYDIINILKSRLIKYNEKFFKLLEKTKKKT